MIRQKAASNGRIVCCRSGIDMARRVCPCGFCETPNLPSACSACINARLSDKYKLLRKLSRNRDILRMRVDACIKSKREADEQHHWRVTHAENITKFKEKLQESERDLRKGKEELSEKQRDLDARSSFLAVASAQLAKKQVEQLGHFQPDLVRAHMLGHTSMASELHQKRRIVIRQLCKAFPLKLVSPSNAGGRKEGSNLSQYWTICGARLPVGDDPHSISSQELAASLGYMVQLLNLVSQYLSAPLLHSARFAGSASRIWQRSSYWDSDSSGSIEYPLYIPQHSCTSSEDHIFPDKGTSILGFSSTEGPGTGSLEDGNLRSPRYEGDYLQSMETHKEVQKGIKLLKRSVACVSSYGFNLLLSSVPPNMTTFQAFAELTTLLSSKEVRQRPSRSAQHHISNLAESAQSSSSAMEMSRQGRDTDFKGSVGENFNSINSFLYIRRDFDQIEGKFGESILDGWDMVEHPTLPPPPSHSEDVEHWTRALFVDVTK